MEEKHLSERNDIKGYINKVIKSSIVDGPGNRLAIFMQGCNFDCWYCHNPETIEIGQKNDEVMCYSARELFDETSKYFDFIDGITISGGEALLQQDFIIEFFKLVKNHCDISCMIDTNGSVVIKTELLALTDKFILDVKVLDENEHIKLTGVSNKQVLKNLELLAAMDKLYEVRTVLYPGYDHQQTIDYILSVVDEKLFRKIAYHEHGVRKQYLK